MLCVSIDDPEDSELGSVAEKAPLGKDLISLGVGEGFITGNTGQKTSQISSKVLGHEIVIYIHLIYNLAC